MKKFYKIALLLVILIFLTTYNPKELYLISKNDFLFNIDNIEVKNNNLIEKDKIIEKLSDIYNRNIFLIKKSDITEPLKEINFLKKIEVKKKYPSTLIIKIYETKPVAIIFKNKIKFFIDNSSNLIINKNEDHSIDLPKVFGENAEKKFMSFYNKLKKANFPLKYIKAFYYFKIGRWDLHLINEKTIKFPSNNIDLAITKSTELLNRKDFENYNIIDLRVGDKIIVE
tara:strand:+ start:264 stop:944 length:681 start_codon:yes stop_codon:yes gene_type:complete